MLDEDSKNTWPISEKDLYFESLKYHHGTWHVYEPYNKTCSCYLRRVVKLICVCNDKICDVSINSPKSKKRKRQCTWHELHTRCLNRKFCTSLEFCCCSKVWLCQHHTSNEADVSKIWQRYTLAFKANLKHGLGIGLKSDWIWIGY